MDLSWQSNVSAFEYITGHIFLLASMPSNFLLDVGHCEFYVVGCWVLLFFSEQFSDFGVGC